MNFSAKTEYACIALIELALHHDSGEPVQIGRIAERHGIPARFLVQILLQLKSAGLVSSTRGSAGGYQLVRRPDELTLGDIMRVIDRSSPEIRSSVEIETPVSRTLLDTWQRLANAERDMLDATTLADLAERSRQANAAMYYI